MCQTNSSKEKRRYLRIPRENIVYVSLCDALEELNMKKRSSKIKAKTKDLSAGGLLFECTKRFDLGHILKVEIILPSWEKYKKTLFSSKWCYPTKPFLVLGKVMRIECVQENIYDIGISFVGIEEAYQDLLINYVNDQLVQEKKA